jgi:hypothetical protein
MMCGGLKFFRDVLVLLHRVVRSTYDRVYREVCLLCSCEVCGIYEPSITINSKDTVRE